MTRRKVWLGEWLWPLPVLAVFGLVQAVHSANQPRPQPRGLEAYVGWYQLAPSDRRLLTYAADGDLRLISFEGTCAAERFVRLAEREFVWERKEAPDVDVRFVTDRRENTVYFRWSDDDGVVHAASQNTRQGYDVRELQYESGGTMLSASLFVPRSQGPHAAAVMIHGSGDSDRDNLWYMWIAHTLVEGGIAVLLPDKRGCGKSAGDWTTASFQDFARDARAGVSATQGHADIDPNRIGLLGISQGGWIAPLAAATLPRLAFVVSVSGAVVTPNEQLRHELGGNPLATWFAKLGRRAWWERNGDFDPLPYWATFAGPSLILYGEDDEQDNVPVTRCEGLLQAVKRKNPHLDITVEVFEGTGHGFFETGTKRIRRDFLELLTAWIGEKVSSPPSRTAEAAPTKSETLPLQVGITGSAPAEDAQNPTRILGSARVQRAILDIAEAPRERRFVEAAIADERFTVEDMASAGLLRQEDGRYWIDFNLLTVEDQQAILHASEERGRELAFAFLNRRADFERLVETHGFPRSMIPQLYFIVLGCFSLDWDGLELTEEAGYREGAQRSIGGHSFTPWAKQRGAEVSRKGLYWGSHNQSVAGFTFTTFGDHHSTPRFGLPDLLWGSRRAFSRYAELPDAQRAGARMVAAYTHGAFEDIAEIMVTLRHGHRSMRELVRETGIERDTLQRVLELLEAAEYVQRAGETYEGRALVLVPDDAALVGAMRAIGREIIAAWHHAHYSSVRSQLADLTPLRNGVPFERVYTEVWHFIFGIANRTLVEEGFFADPYAAHRAHQGFLPAIFSNRVAESP